MTLEGRVALVTGASRGIGRALAVALAREGAHVVALARGQGALEFLYDEIVGFGGQATIVPLDVTEFDNLDRLGACIHERWKKLDILVGNAGLLGPVTPLPHVDPPQWSRLFDVNVTANWRLIRAMDVLLRSSDAGRAVFVTSGAAHRIKPYWGPYAVTKAALNALGRTYAAETQNTSQVKVMLANPGPLRTQMRAAAMPGEDPMTLRTPEELAPKLVALCRPDWTETGKLYDFPTDSIIDFA
ncbi:oxidoreductase [Methylosinus sp. R-45379]|jgi:NAD(P)-dependent dehydrogenase (short-subunit alcohol dehydrogenase family)|uniref:SDR family NAD(P)-dependent oxidoreductase n=1 Tax=unclassified Methylosinus TaxID=2624500 RepID=UPI000467AEAE|nr:MULTISPECIES: SDR family NAD(P)-dependent oxidoreductase [unclassified Methylosinus]OAI31713.1 oxidoreductase [Methylosinus sp. R-45379]TDX62701.1 NAD(P)-dependent dehydrogenase (short-subunit alcohol dehydrogenase family) [Methylosinus sp. sav-2]